MNGSCVSTQDVAYQGVQLGADIASLNLGSSGANLHIGLLGGYTQSQTHEDGGLFGAGSSSSFQVPSFGAYATFKDGNFFADLQARGDYYEALNNDPSPTGSAVVNQRVNATSRTILANLGYHFDLGANWFVEPSIGGSYSRIRVDQLPYDGSFIVVGTGAGFSGFVSVAPITSTLGRASVRVGTSVVMDKFVLNPFASLSIFNEFSGKVNAGFVGSYGNTAFNGAFTGNVTGSSATATATMARVGSFGQLSAGVSGQLIGTGWLGFLRGDVRFGNTLRAYALTGGLRYQFNPEEPVARTNVKGPAWTASKPVNWTGLYIGGLFGPSITGTQTMGFNGGPAGTRSGFAGIGVGGTAGFNYQFNRIVLGVEGDYAWSNAIGGVVCPLTAGSSLYTCQGGVSSLGSLTARAGYSAGRALMFVKGGLAFGQTVDRESFNSPLPLIPGVAPPFTTSSSASKFSTGWTVGLGLEYAMSEHWSAKGEFGVYNLGKATYSNYGGAILVKGATSGNIGKIGLNYHFN